jgi:hypothetical protein
MNASTGFVAASAARMVEEACHQRSRAALRRRAERSAARQLTARRRAHGLVDRQAARLARGRQFLLEPDLDRTRLPCEPDLDRAAPFEPDLDCTQ